jgi:hypothetical protein
MRTLFSFGLVLTLTVAAHAQSLNIDFGKPSTAPSSSYAGAGRTGVWSTIGVMPTSVRFPLVDRAGNAIAGQVYNLGGSAMLEFNDPATSGDDERLIDDMFLSFNNPADLCLFFENLALGEYEVVIYALTPNDPALMCRVRVDFATPGPVMVGGAWPGGHQEFVTFARHRVAVTDGRLGLHSGLFNGFIQSGINGLQLLYREPCAGDADRNYDVNFADITTILSNFGDTGPIGDVIGDANNDGVVDFADVTAALAAFGSLC